MIDGWRGDIPKENVMKSELWGIFQDRDEVERIFDIIFKQRDDY